MKRFFVLLLFLFSLFIISNNSYAFPVAVGDTVYVVDGLGTTGGGEVFVNDSSGNFLFIAFCLEIDEHLGGTGPFDVYDISDTAYAGGANTDAGDPISYQTKWLYSNYLLGNLAGIGGFAYNQVASINALQRIIWYFEEEVTSPYFGGHTSEEEPIMLSLIDAANAADANHIPIIGDIQVLNISKNGDLKQSLLVGVVPEPGTLALVGFGLLGLGFYGRRRMKK